MSNTEISDWIGREQSVTDTIDLNRAQAMNATLNIPVNLIQSGTALPHLWHWLYFWELTQHQGLANDGHARRGGFLPPIQLPRRMWAGGQLEFLHPLEIGAMAERRSRIENIESKEGKSGKLSFVTVAHEIFSGGKCCIREIQSIVYREAAKPSDLSGSSTRQSNSASVSPPLHPDFSKEIKPDPLLLFRYSALTFNAHRIHYDRGYVTEDEGYPGLLVHGPLLATLLVQVAEEQFPEKIIRSFNFRAVGPTFDLEPFSVNGRFTDSDESIELWIANKDGEICMKATADVGN